MAVSGNSWFHVSEDLRIPSHTMESLKDIIISTPHLDDVAFHFHIADKSNHYLIHVKFFKDKAYAAEIVSLQGKVYRSVQSLEHTAEQFRTFVKGMIFAARHPILTQERLQELSAAQALMNMRS